MPEFLTAIPASEVWLTVLWVGAVLALVLKLWQVLRKLDGFLVEWNGKPVKRDAQGNETDPGTPGVAFRIKALEAQTKKIHHEVTPNHGGSIKDEIGRVETVVNSLTEKLGEHIDISKSKDAEQEETARQVGLLAAKYTPAE